LRIKIQNVSGIKNNKDRGISGQLDAQLLRKQLQALLNLSSTPFSKVTQLLEKAKVIDAAHL